MRISYRTDERTAQRLQRQAAEYHGVRVKPACGQCWLRRFFGICCILSNAALGLQAIAGGSPETTLVVVNAASPLSQSIANKYLELRQIPETHLVRLEGIPTRGHPSIEVFRRTILQPISAYIRKHGLEEEIDLIAYSGDFPYGVNFSPDVRKKKLPKNRYRGQVASLTGLTFFANRVEVGDTGYLGVNHYFRKFVGPDKRLLHVGAADAALTDGEFKRLRTAASKAMQKEDFVEAAEHYRRIAQDRPGSPEHWYDLARAEAAAGQTNQALKSLTKSVSLGWANSVRARRERAFISLRVLPAFQKLLTRMERAYGPFELSHGFRHRYVWSNSDLRFWETDDRLNQYYLSAMLAYIGPRGNSFPEIVNYLERSSASDGTAPTGTVYLMESSNVRSTTRQPLFFAALSQLAGRGRKAEILARGREGQDGIVPVGKDDVIGIVAGTADIRWDRARSRFLPGAIAESLTSYGAHFDRGKQTKLTEFLRQGAAGSSGAVAEPYSFQEKFPVPLLHVFYADGCSLAEAFYQSVATPYQLLVVGDPLARPFAKFAEVALRSPDPKQPWSGIVTLEPAVRPAPETAIGRTELWVDGQLVAAETAGETLYWDTQMIDDGIHDLRIIAVEDSPVETRSMYRTTVEINNLDLRVSIDEAPDRVAFGKPVELAGKALGAARVEVWRGHHLLGTGDVKQGRWRIGVPTDAIGLGIGSVFVRAVHADGKGVRSALIPIFVQAPSLQPSVREANPPNTGLLAVVASENGDIQMLTINRLNGRLKGVGKKVPKPVKAQLFGYMKVERSGIFQLGVRSAGRVKLLVGSNELLDSTLSQRGATRFLIVGLEAGWHPIEIELQPVKKHFDLELVLAGDEVPTALAGKRLAHDAAEKSPDRSVVNGQ